jgi:hypothetical protein
MGVGLASSLITLTPLFIIDARLRATPPLRDKKTFFNFPADPDLGGVWGKVYNGEVCLKQ